jgi:hypothetical protein
MEYERKQMTILLEASLMAFHLGELENASTTVVFGRLHFEYSVGTKDGGSAGDSRMVPYLLLILVAKVLTVSSL